MSAPREVNRSLGIRPARRIGYEPPIKTCRKGLVMNTFLIASQIACYGIGIVSASLNIATFVRRRHARLRRITGGQQSLRALA
jgi:hypothetical protein